MASSSSSASSSGSSSASLAGATVVGGKTILPATNCSWQQVVDADGACYLEPRSCYDCLNTPLASGSECVLTPLGLCRELAAYDSSLDYRRSAPSGAYPIHYNYFPETNTTYCEADDEVCNTCRQSSFTVGNKNPSLYCEGVDACVCVAICESEAWRNDTLQQLRELLATADDDSACPVAANTTYEYTTGSDGSSDASELGGATVKDVYASDDACRWYQNSTYCETPRSCYDCLNTPLYSGEACTITPAGYCASMSAYDYVYDYRRVLSNTSGAHYFPSTNASYCEADDPVCAACRQDSAAFASAAGGQHNVTAYCVGADDCVCVAFCESVNWTTVVQAEACDASAQQVTDASSTRIPTVGIIAIAMVGCVLLFSAFMQVMTMVRMRRRRAYWESQASQRMQPRRPPTVGLGLELSAWKQLRARVISTERERFSREDEEDEIDSEDATGYDEVDDAELERAPPARVPALLLPAGHRLRDSAQDAPCVVVEDGEGFRPASPSRTRRSSI